MENDIRVTSRLLYRQALGEARKLFVEQLSANTGLPILELTGKQYASGDWKIPIAYKPITVDVYARVATLFQMGSQLYTMSTAQLLYAFLEAAKDCGKLQVDGRHPIE